MQSKKNGTWNYEAKRARRRRDLERMKAKARRIYPHDKDAKWAEHLQGCSCSMCGNPRRSSWFKGERLTIQERKFYEGNADGDNE